MAFSGPLIAQAELSRGLDRGELHLAFQPIVDLYDASVVGVEALLRWQHPERGLLWPDEFLLFAQDDLSSRIGRWVVQTAASYAGRWRQQFPGDPIVVGVNMSGRQLDPGDLAVWEERLTRLKIDPGSLAVEIGETELLGDTDRNRTRLEAVKGLGLRVVVDDFGSTYVSDATSAGAARDEAVAALELLDQLPIDVVKLDRNLVTAGGTSERDAELVADLVGLAHRDGLHVIAEGVETRDEVRLLIEVGCDLAQGYHYHRPQPPEYVDVVLAEQARARSSSPEPTPAAPAERTA
jgi:EAL domain-containing protein (putative c-di-GMP-specific phosphodiesterase class I)